MHQSKTVAIYAGAMMLSAVSPFVYIPAIVSVAGNNGWAALAIGQSVGAAAAVLVAFGWPFAGPRLIADCVTSERPRLIQSAFGAQLYLYFISMAIAIPLVSLLSPTNFGLSIAGCAASGLAGISPNWYYIGTQRPWLLLLLDSLPKLLGAAAGSALVLVFQRASLVPLAQICVTTAALVIALLVVAGRFGLPADDLKVRSVIRTLRSQSAFASTQAASAVYINLPTALLSSVSPSSVAAFAATERLFRLGLTALNPLTQASQGWVAGAEESLNRRLRISVALHLSVGLAAGACLYIFGPFVATLVFGSEVPISYTILISFCLGVPVVMLSRAIGSNVLTFWRLESSLARSAACGAVIAIIAIPTLGFFYGGPGAAWALVAAEMAVLVWQILATLRKVRGNRNTDSNPAKVSP